MSGEVFLADEGAADREQRFVDVCAAVVAPGDAAVVVQPGERPLDDPPLGPQAGAVLGVALGDLRRDPAGTQLGAMASGVVSSVGQQRLGAKLAVRSDGRDAIDERANSERCKVGEEMTSPRREQGASRVLPAMALLGEVKLSEQKVEDVVEDAVFFGK